MHCAQLRTQLTKHTHTHECTSAWVSPEESGTDRRRRESERYRRAAPGADHVGGVE